MATNRTDREVEGTGRDSARVNLKDRDYVPGEDPVADTDPNAEGASLATDETGLSQVDELRREAESEDEAETEGTELSREKGDFNPPAEKPRAGTPRYN